MWCQGRKEKTGTLDHKAKYEIDKLKYFPFKIQLLLGEIDTVSVMNEIHLFIVAPRFLTEDTAMPCKDIWDT